MYHVDNVLRELEKKFRGTVSEQTRRSVEWFHSHR